MKKSLIIKSSAYLASIGVTMLLAGSALAQDAGTVTGNVECGRTGQDECGYSDLIVLVQNLINFAVLYVIIPIMILIILRAGVLLIVSGDKVAAKNDAKKALGKAFIGLFLVLGAWLIVEGLINFFGVKVNSDATKGPLKVLGN
jgi:threonine/homoserine/homoserine lactone efflux protein